MYTNNDFSTLKQFIDESNATNSTNEKVVILNKYKNNEFIKKVLLYTYTGFKQYYVKASNLKKNHKLCAVSPVYTDLFDLLDALDARKITGHDAIKEVNGFISDNEQYRNLIYTIFDRNLKNRISTSLIERIFPGLIPTFDVALANKYDERMSKKIDFTKEKWFVSRKLDGIRCIVMIDSVGNIKTLSRSGNEIETLTVLKDEIKQLNLKNCVIDGEVCIVDENGKENFQGIIKEHNRKNHTIKNPKLLIFDIISLEDFIKKEGETLLSIRYNNLKFLLNSNSYNKNILEMLPQIEVTDGTILTEMIAQGKKEGWEGVMLRKNIPYEGKRSNNLLKVKSFFDAEYIVKKVDVGPFRVIVDGLEVTETVMRSVTIDHKGYEVNVGSGFSLNERRYYKDHPKDLIGKEIKVKYFEESHNQQGEISLRFPTVVCIYTQGKRDD